LSNSTAPRGKLIVLTAPSGTGKTTIAQRLLKDRDDLHFSVSATTRNPRPDEKDGIDYHFMTDDRFDELIKRGAFIEWESFYDGTRYGTLHSEVDKQIESGYFILLDIDVKGAWNVKQHYGGDCLSIFIRPPSLDVLKERLKQRGTENEESLRLRLERASMEMEYEDNFDEVVVNEDLEAAYDQINSIITRFTEA